jgi:hypothetical protein
VNAVFVRHNLKSEAIVIDLWSKRLIAIHFDNIDSIDPEKYKEAEGKASLKRLLSYCRDGAMVGATYRTAYPEKLLVGEIAPGSQIEILNYQTDTGNHYLKTAQLLKVQEISYSDHPLLSAIQPRHKTITNWKSAQKYLMALQNKEPLEPSVNSLAPSQLEVICYEYLRANQLLAALVLPIGRSLPDIDIYGIDKDGNKILSQVTHGKNIVRKLMRLKRFQDLNTKLVFFGPIDSRIDDEHVHYIPIELVFTSFWNSDKNSIQRRLIEKMLPGKILGG